MIPTTQRYVQAVRAARPFDRVGTVRNCVGTIVSAMGPRASLGELCRILPGSGTSIDAEVVGFRENELLLMPFDELIGIGPGDKVVACGETIALPPAETLLGTAVDALARPLGQGANPIPHGDTAPKLTVPNPLKRARIKQIFHTGVRSIDGLLTVGVGQRIGIFSGSGVGKSSLLGMIARGSMADVNVIALIGERGREVREFIEDHLADGLQKSVVVVATSDQSPLMRVQAAATATSIASQFRSRGRHVALFLDSLTRYAMAKREIGLSVGEPPTARGYTPSVFSALPRLLEQAGMSEDASGGSITGIYTVLVEGDDLNEPLSDHARAILDGHIVLSRTIAGRGIYPAVDLIASISRVMPQLIPPEDQRLVSEVRSIFAMLAESKDAIDLGVYQSGSNPALDRALDLSPKLEKWMTQAPGEREDRAAALSELRLLMSQAA